MSFLRCKILLELTGFLTGKLYTLLAGLKNGQVTSNKLMGEDNWIEALIVADESIVAFHGKDKVEKYLLILSNMVCCCCDIILLVRSACTF